jgi:hypothetical protein
VTATDAALRGAASGGPSGWRRTLAERVSLRVLAASIVLGFVLGTFLTAVAWTTFGVEEVGPPKDVLLTVPMGTAAEIAAGRPGAIPSEIRMVSGDRLVIRNDDVVAHTLGGWTVEPGMVLTVVTDAPAANVFACTIHPSGSLGLIVTPLPGLIDAILVIIMVSVPIGLVLAAGWTVFRMLDTDDLEVEKAAA